MSNNNTFWNDLVMAIMRCFHRFSQVYGHLDCLSFLVDFCLIIDFISRDFIKNCQKANCNGTAAALTRTKLFSPARGHLL